MQEYALPGHWPKDCYKNNERKVLLKRSFKTTNGEEINQWRSGRNDAGTPGTNRETAAIPRHSRQVSFLQSENLNFTSQTPSVRKEADNM